MLNKVAGDLLEDANQINIINCISLEDQSSVRAEQNASNKSKRLIINNDQTIGFVGIDNNCGAEFVLSTKPAQPDQLAAERRRRVRPAGMSCCSTAGCSTAGFSTTGWATTFSATAVAAAARTGAGVDEPERTLP